MKGGILQIDGEEVVEFSWTGGGKRSSVTHVPDTLVITVLSSVAIVWVVVILIWFIKEMILFLSS